MKRNDKIARIVRELKKRGMSNIEIHKQTGIPLKEIVEILVGEL